ncbi:YrdB family protein [Kitasatospora sp. NPDC002227]|uniref:YrdB family protein n=1 Tax=Kitasatospora sp. NPDC002227 TaxID=3154773 RepID=UPI00332813B8
MLPQPLHVFNEGLAFILEVAALAALCWWGFSTGSNVGVHVLLGLGAPLLAAVLWGTFAAPKARINVSLPYVLLVKFVVFAAATLALWAIDRHSLAIVFGVVALINTTVATKDRQALVNQRF